jgi:hypothetical protein
MKTLLMKLMIAGILFLAALTSCSSRELQTLSGEPDSSQEAEKIILDDLGPAPELSNETWLNTDQPLRLADLRGKVVLLEMWTFG